MSADDARKLFIGGLSDSVDETELRSFFESAQLVVEFVAIPRDRETGKPRGFGFVTLGSPADVTQALTLLNGKICGGRPLSIRPFSQEPPKRGAERTTRGAPEPSLFLGKLPFDATETELRALFEAQGVGGITRLSLPIGQDGRPRGFGFATLEDESLAQDAIEKLDGMLVRGRPIVVSKVQPKGQGRPAGGGGGFSSEGPRRPRDAAPREEGYNPGFRPSGGGSYDMPSFPPPFVEGGDARGGGARRRGEGRKPEKKPEKKRGGFRENTKGPRGGGGNWHRWEDED